MSALRRVGRSLRLSYLFWRYHRLQLRIGTAERLYHSTAMEHIRDALRERIAQDSMRANAICARIGRTPRP